MCIDSYNYDVFLSHNSKDKTVAREIATRLREAEIRLWFDEWVLKPGDSIPAMIEEGLEHSRVLVLCMSANALGSDPGVPGLEAPTCGRGNLPFRGPLNRETLLRVRT